MEKQFLPLPPLRKSHQETSIHIQEPSTGSVSEAEDETSNSSTSVLGLATTNGDYKFIFGNFHLDAVSFDPAIVIKPKFDGTVIKFGEISCSLSLVNDLVKFDPVNLDSAKSTENRSISEISISCFDAFIDAVSAIRFFKLILCINDFEKFVMEIDVLWIAKDASIAWLMIDSTVAVPVTSSRCIVTIFDPDGVIEPLSVMILPGAITVEFVNDFVVTVFNPGRNHHRSPPLTTKSTHNFLLNSIWLLNSSLLLNSIWLLNSFFLVMMLPLSYHSLKTSHFVFDPGGNQLISVLVNYYFDTLIRCLF
jgi:hypothetical protein